MIAIGLILFALLAVIAPQKARIKWESSHPSTFTAPKPVPKPAPKPVHKPSRDPDFPCEVC